jgi:hypothetical protein
MEVHVGSDGKVGVWPKLERHALAHMELFLFLCYWIMEGLDNKFIINVLVIRMTLVANDVHNFDCFTSYNDSKVCGNENFVSGSAAAGSTEE